MFAYDRLPAVCGVVLTLTIKKEQAAVFNVHRVVLVTSLRRTVGTTRPEKGRRVHSAVSVCLASRLKTRYQAILVTTASRAGMGK